MKHLILLTMLLVSTTPAWSIFGRGKKRAMQEGDITALDCATENSKEMALKRLKEKKVRVNKRKIKRACNKITAQINSRRPLVESDLSVKDCQSERAMNKVRTELHKEGVDVGYSSVRVRQMCRTVLTKNNKGVATRPLSSTGTAASTAGISFASLDKRIEAFTATIRQDFSICSNLKKQNVTAKAHQISTLTANTICTKMRRNILQNLGPAADPTFGDEAFLGNILDEILRSTDIRRNVYVTGLRRRFARSYKPGIEYDAPSPATLLDRDEGWICRVHKPFTDGPGGNVTGSPMNLSTLRFTIMNHLIEDDNGFLYDTANGMELAATGLNGEIVRSIRLEYYCQDADFRDCNEENANSRTLIIEEAIRVKSLVMRFFGHLFDNVPMVRSELENTLHSYLAARAGRSMNDYLTENREHCTGEEFFRGCETAVNYLECFDDHSAILDKILRR